VTDYKAIEEVVMGKVKSAVHDVLGSLEDNEPTIDTVISAALDAAGFPAEIGTAAGHLVNMLVSMGAAHVNKAPVTSAPVATTVPTPVVAAPAAPAAPVTEPVAPPVTTAPIATTEVVQGPDVAAQPPYSV
jgi:hypothetical protein